MLGVAGVRTVIVSLGLNDIMIPSTLPMFGKPEFAAESVSAIDIINGLKQLVVRARSQNVKVIGATITPFGSSTVPGVYTPETEAKRQAVNRWIRTGGGFDGVIDFEAAVRDPANPSRLLAIYDADARPGVFGDPPGSDVLAWLERHGVLAKLVLGQSERHGLLKRPGNVGEQLLALASERDCDLLVMGAYGHSRFRETLLGGVTRSVLDTMTLPLLMSH